RQMNVPIEFVDVGGGLGVDYDGTRSANANSVNYSIQEYANDVVYSMVSAADKAGLPHPNVVAESGRALTAHHSVLVFNVLETTALPQWYDSEYVVGEQDHESVRELHAIHRNLSNNGVL